MNEFSLYRLVFFFGILFAIVCWEYILPRRNLTMGRSRWTGNLGVTMINAVMNGMVPFTPVAAAYLAAGNQWGIMHRFQLNFWASVVIGIAALDLIIYFQHVMFHALPSLWRLHMMHHADHDIDATTGLRFHPLEIVISLGIKSAAVVLLGVPPRVVFLFEIILNGMSMFNHGNVRIPLTADRILRKVIVTPDMHRVHHSVIINETNSNFGFNLSLWDYIFGSYRGYPIAGHDKMVIGVSHLRNTRWQNIAWMLLLPFIAGPGPYPLVRQGRKISSE